VASPAGSWVQRQLREGRRRWWPTLPRHRSRIPAACSGSLRLAAMRGLEGKRAIVTGAARGIGRAIAERLIRERGRVALVDVDADALREAATALGGDAPGLHADAASKAGMVGLVRTMAADYAGDGIRVNAVFPGITETPMNRWWTDDPAMRERVLAPVPLGRPARAEEVAAVAAFLACD